MKRLLLSSLLLSLFPSANAGIYYHPFYQNGIEIRCSDDDPRHSISFKNGRYMLFEDDGDEKYKFPKTFLWPEKLISDIHTFQVQPVRSVVQENLLKKRENFI